MIFVCLCLLTSLSRTVSRSIHFVANITILLLTAAIQSIVHSHPQCTSSNPFSTSFSVLCLFFENSHPNG